MRQPLHVAAVVAHRLLQRGEKLVDVITDPFGIRRVALGPQVVGMLDEFRSRSQSKQSTRGPRRRSTRSPRLLAPSPT
jgi:hypothetical protein